MTAEKFKVCLIEYENHSEVIRSLTHFFRDSDWQVTIISHKKCLDNLGDLEDNEKVKLVLFEQALEVLTIQFDIYLYITPYDYTKVVNPIVEPSRAYLMIHNHNYWLDPKRNIFFLRKILRSPFRHMIRFFKYWKINSFGNNQDFLLSFKGIIVPSKAIYDHSPFSIKLSGFLDVGYANEEVFSKYKDDAIRIVIPGSVHPDKNPVHIIQSLKRMSEKEQAKIEIILTGVNRLLSEKFIQSKKSKNFNLIVFNKPIPQEDYDFIMQKADLGIIALEKNKDYKGILETKGTTNITGGIFDMYRFNIPFLLPEYYPTVEEEKLVFRYHNAQEVVSFVIQMIKNKGPIKEGGFEKTKNSIFRLNTKMVHSLLDKNHHRNDPLKASNNLIS